MEGPTDGGAGRGSSQAPMDIETEGTGGEFLDGVEYDYVVPVTISNGTKSQLGINIGGLFTHSLAFQTFISLFLRKFFRP